MQKDAKSEILAWDKYLFVSENESGLRMLFKEDGEINASLDRPGEDPDNHVTNSVTMNSDRKKNYRGNDVESNLLLLANGTKGIYWYDVVQDADEIDKIIPCRNNSILAGTGSANFIASKGNIVFVADGLGGLKVLYIGFNKGDTPPPVLPPACDDYMSYLYGYSGNVLLIESSSVFRGGANPIIKTLFSDPSNIQQYIEVKKTTELYISYIIEEASLKNSLGYFVIPASVEKTNEAEYEYYIKTIEPNMYTLMGGQAFLKEEYIVFKNISDSSEGGPLTKSATFQIGNGKFSAGDRVVLFMLPDAWSPQNNGVRISPNGYDRMFFTHTWFNLVTDIPYHSAFGNFKGVQHNSFYSADCKSIVFFFEDKHSFAGVDTDYNDVIISISDNYEGKDIVNIVIPKYTIVTTTGKPKLVESSTL